MLVINFDHDSATLLRKRLRVIAGSELIDSRDFYQSIENVLGKLESPVSHERVVIADSEIEPRILKADTGVVNELYLRIAPIIKIVNELNKLGIDKVELARAIEIRPDKLDVTSDAAIKYRANSSAIIRWASLENSPFYQDFRRYDQLIWEGNTAGRAEFERMLLMQYTSDTTAELEAKALKIKELEAHLKSVNLYERLVAKHESQSVSNIRLDEQRDSDKDWTNGFLSDQLLYFKYKNKITQDLKFFDRNYYVQKYPDLAQLNNPVKHFIVYGINEGREGSKQYKSATQDLRKQYISSGTSLPWNIFLLKRL